jgi:hypothetical protein
MHPDTRSEFTLGATEAKAIASISETYHAIRQHIHEGTSIAHLISRLEHSDTQTMLKKVRGRVTAKETNVALPTPIERDSAGRLSGVPMMDSIKSIVGGKTGGASQTAHSIEVIQAMLDANNKALAVLADSTAKMADAIKKLAERQDTGTNTAQPPTRKWKEVVS